MQKGDRSKQALFWTTCALIKTSDQIIAMKPSKDRRGKLNKTQEMKITLTWKNEKQKTVL
jgi:5-enolpyruvylshikimate-3-phosphate synthase